LNRIEIGSTLEEEKYQIVADAAKFQKGLMQITLAFNFFEPVRAAMEISQCLRQAVPVGGSPLLQLPGVSVAVARDLRIRETLPIKTIQDLLSLNEQDRRKALEGLDEKAYSHFGFIKRPLQRYHTTMMSS
jgi:preprotein translocase subunit Sec63